MGGFAALPGSFNRLVRNAPGRFIYGCRNAGRLAGHIYIDDLRAIYINRRIPAAWVLPVLAHETFHAAARHDGHQSPPVEARIDEAVAQAIINPSDYEFWESQYGWSTGGIAAALNLPRWVIEAYRRKLAQMHPVTL